MNYRKVLPSVEIVLSRHCLDQNHPGYQKPAIRVLTIFSSGKLAVTSQNRSEDSKIEKNRNLNREYQPPQALRKEDYYNTKQYHEEPYN